MAMSLQPVCVLLILCVTCTFVPCLLSAMRETQPQAFMSHLYTPLDMCKQRSRAARTTQLDPTYTPNLLGQIYCSSLRGL